MKDNFRNTRRIFTLRNIALELLLLFFTLSKIAKCQDIGSYSRSKFESCNVNTAQYATDSVSDPVENIGSKTFSACMSACENEVDEYGRECVAIELKDMGISKSWISKINFKFTCKLAWGCDYESEWSSGSIYYRNGRPTSTPTSSSRPSAMLSSQPSSSMNPSMAPSYVPSASLNPTEIPSNNPSMSPSNIPSFNPSSFPSGVPSLIPSSAPSHGCIGDSILTFSGTCNYTNYLSVMYEQGCSEEESIKLLGLNDNDSGEANEKITELCEDATAEERSSFFPFEEISKLGDQFDAEFMNGGSEWNVSPIPSSVDLNRVDLVQERILTSRGITFPDSLQNFDTSSDEESCSLNTVMCCWSMYDTSSKKCDEDGTNCDYTSSFGNADVCHADIQNSPKSSHLLGGAILFDTDVGTSNVECKGFTWKVDEETDLYKGNTLFKLAMSYGLKDQKYTGNTPHSPMCACIEKMPLVSEADCIDIDEPHYEWSFRLDFDKQSITLWKSLVGLTFNDCNGLDLASHFKETHESNSEIIDNYLIGNCSHTEEEASTYSFMKDRMKIQPADMSWIKIAGKGVYAETSNYLHSELLTNDNEILHSSMNRTTFESFWKNSTYIILRRCKDCDISYRYIYYKRYNASLEDIDLLYVLKENWHEFENHMAHVNFDLYSTIEHALENENEWTYMDFNPDAGISTAIGFPGTNGQYDEFTANNGEEDIVQWHTWGTKGFDDDYGQENVAFYLGLSLN